MSTPAKAVPWEKLRAIFASYHDHTSRKRTETRERLLQKLAFADKFKVSYTALENNVVSPSALNTLKLEYWDIDGVIVVVGEFTKENLSLMLEASQRFIRSRRRFHIIHVKYTDDGNKSKTCQATVQQFRLKDLIPTLAMKRTIDQDSFDTKSETSDSASIMSAPTFTEYSWVSLRDSHSMRSAINTEDFVSAVSEIHNAERYSLVSGRSRSSYHTARSGNGSVEGKVSTTKRLQRNDKYSRLLCAENLWPVDPSIEQDWSGRGQHAEFQSIERKIVNDLLEPHEILGNTNTAVVESVKCRRILLARKTITCVNHQFSKRQAIKEVAHLTRMNHAHILRVIGTYVMGRCLSILLYPVASCNLHVFLEAMRTTRTSEKKKSIMFSSGKDFFGCLVNATKYIHQNLVKHMDIKPQNILIRKVPDYVLHMYTVLIADFGIARSYNRPEEVETNGLTQFTPKYAAPEVIEQEMRGLPADIFSLGCVFLELFVSLFDTVSCIKEQKQAALLEREAKFTQPQWSYLQSLLELHTSGSNGGNSYAASIETLQQYYRGVTETLRLFPTSDIWFSTICDMIDRNPKERPTASQLEVVFGKLACCDGGACALEAHVDDVTTDEESGDESEGPLPDAVEQRNTVL